MKECNHKVNTPNSTIILSEELKTFVFPKRTYGVCKFCGKNFEYILDMKGNLKKYKEGKQ